MRVGRKMKYGITRSVGRGIDDRWCGIWGWGGYLVYDSRDWMILGGRVPNCLRDSFFENITEATSLVFLKTRRGCSKTKTPKK